MALEKQTPLERYVRALEEIASAHIKGLALTELSRRCGLPPRHLIEQFRL